MAVRPLPAMSPEISLVLTSYNFRPYLRAAVASLLAQRTRRTLEVIVVDDASPDGSTEVLADLDDPRLTVVRHDRNHGFTASITEGMLQARGRYVGRFDGDDVWLPDAVERLAAALDANPSAPVAYGDVCTIDAEGRIGGTGINRPPGPLLRDEFGLLLERHYTCAPAMLGRMDDWRELLPWPERFRTGLGDWYFNLRLARRGPFVHVPEVLAHYRVHAQGMHNTLIRDRSGEANARGILDEFLPLATPAQLGGQAPARVYARCLLGFAREYFGAGMEPDARRLYREILGRQPGLLLNRRDLPPALAALTLGKRRYDRLKSLLLGQRAA